MLFCNLLFKALRAVRRARFLDFCSIFDTLLRPWSVFWSHFCHWILIFGALWQHFLHQELDWSAKAATGGAKGRHPRNKLTFLDTCWESFLKSFVFFAKTERFRNRLLFFFNFFVTLSAPRDGLICDPYTPAQSKHTFSFSCFSGKSFKNTVCWVHFGSNLRHKFDICVKKGTPKKCLKKGAQTDSNGKLFQCPEAP